MADLPAPQLEFRPGCPDCAERTVRLPAPLPDVGDDFDWRVRDYDGFRLSMLEELAARFPERDRWTPADEEVVLVEAFAAVLDGLSDMLDRVTAEAYLETARIPQSVRRLLLLVGYDAVDRARDDGQIDDTDGAAALDRLWLRRPELMDLARRAGPQEVRRQKRMVTVADHAERLEDHPLVRRATAWTAWTGAWQTVDVAVIALEGHDIDVEGIDFGDVRAAVERFNAEHDIAAPLWGPRATIRTLLQPFIDAYRMAGQPVELQGARRIPVSLALSIRVGADYFRSEIRRAVQQALGTGSGGFFEPGRLRFGEDLHESDLVQALTGLEGVEEVCVNRMTRLDRRSPEPAPPPDRIVFENVEIAACDNDPAHPEHGYYRLTLHGGRAG